MSGLANFDVQSKEIGGVAYYVRPFPPLQALDLLGDLQSVITTSLGKATANDDADNILDKQIDMATFIAGLGANLKGKILVQYAERILNQEYVSAQRTQDESPSKLTKQLSDELFTGRISDMLQVMWFVLEVNYSDFFDSVPDLSGLAKMLGNK